MSDTKYIKYSKNRVNTFDYYKLDYLWDYALNELYIKYKYNYEMIAEALSCPVSLVRNNLVKKVVEYKHNKYLAKLALKKSRRQAPKDILKDK